MTEFSWWTSLKVFLVGMVLAGGLFSVRLVTRELPFLTELAYQGLDQAAHHFPSDLRVSWDGERLSASTSEPLSLPYPGNFEFEYFPDHFLYLTQEELILDELPTTAAHSHFIVVTPKLAYVQNATEQWSQLPLTDVMGFDQPFMLAADNKDDVFSQVKSFIAEIQPSLTLMVVVASPLIMMVNTVVQGFLDFVLLYFVVRLSQFRFSWRQVFQLSLHIWIVCQIITQLMFLLYAQLTFSFFSVVFWVIVSYLLFNWTQSIRRIVSQD